MLGRIGKGEFNQSTTTHGIALKDFLDSPGPFLFYEEDGFRVLAHGTNFNNGEYDEEIAEDIWVDGNGDVVRIEKTNRVWDLPEATLRKWGHSGPIHKAQSVAMRIECSDFIDAGNGARLPLKGTIEFYKFDIREWGRLDAEQEKQKLPDSEHKLRLFLMPRTLANKQTLEIDPSSLSVGTPIGPEVFVATYPKGTRVATSKDRKDSYIVGAEKEKPAWYVRYRLWILAGVCVLVVVTLRLAGKRWLGWKY